MNDNRVAVAGVAVGLVADLLDRSRIQGVVRAVGTKIQFASSPDDLVKKLTTETRVIFIDLNDPRVGGIEAIKRIASSRSASSTGAGLLKVIGFVSHSDTETIDAAKSFGCDEVLARSQFFRRLSVELAEATKRG